MNDLHHDLLLELVLFEKRLGEKFLDNVQPNAEDLQGFVFTAEFFIDFINRFVIILD